MKNQPYKVPENYFQNLENEILAKTVNKPKAKNISIAHHKLWVWLSGSAAILLLLIWLNPFNLQKNQPNAALSAQEEIYEIYFEPSNAEIDEYDSVYEEYVELFEDEIPNE